MEPGPILASGRDGDIYEYGPGRVLRKTRDGRVIEIEAKIIRFMAEQGYPVPEIYDVIDDGTAIVMERIEGPIMMDAIAKAPWKLRQYARLIADLHDQLHRIRAPEWMRDLDDGGADVVHLDLHPLNVIMSPRGPVVIDWPNAARGDGLTDVAITYVLLTCPRIPAAAPVRAVLQLARRTFADAFIKRYRTPALAERIAYAAELKSLDLNMEPDEIENCLKLAAKMRQEK